LASRHAIGAGLGLVVGYPSLADTNETGVSDPADGATDSMSPAPGERVIDSVGAYLDLDNASRRQVKIRCRSVVAHGASYDRPLVKLCRMIALR
jgi:hypothetical protein